MLRCAAAKVELNKTAVVKTNKTWILQRDQGSDEELLLALAKGGVKS